MMAMDTPTDIIASIATMDVARDLVLKGDGATVELEDGRELKYRTMPDECMSIMDEQGEDMWCGRLEWEPRRTNDYGHATRPDGMDGRARKIRLGRGGDVVWWQPPADVTDEHLHDLEANISDLFEYGYQCIGVEMSEHVTDSRGGEHVVVVETAWLGGVEAMADDKYVAEFAADLIAEVLGS